MIDKALLNLRPGAVWSMTGDDYFGIEWLDATKTKPTIEEIEQELIRLQQEYLSTEYQRLRMPEYPPIEDYLDGIVKGDQQQIAAYITACQAVKAKYPKPE